LRVREPQIPRPFRVPGGVVGTALLGVLPTILLILAGIYAEHEQIFGMSVWVFGTIVMVAGVAAYGLCSLIPKKERALSHNLSR